MPDVPKKPDTASTPEEKDSSADPTTPIIPQKPEEETSESSQETETGDAQTPETVSEPPEKENTEDAPEKDTVPAAPQKPEKNDSVPLPKKPKKDENTMASQNNPISTKLSADERESLRAQRRKSKRLLSLLRKIAILLLVIITGSYFWFQFNLNKDSNPLSVFGVSENLGMKHKHLKQKTRLLESEKMGIDREISRLQHKLENKEFTVFSPEIEKLRSQQLTWFDRVDANGNLEFGMMEAVPRMAKFFNDREYQDDAQIIAGRPGQIEISNVVVDRSGINFNVSGAELFGNVFFLNLEFVKMVNAFPFLKNGELQTFSKRENQEGEPMMEYAVKLEYQTPDEEDPHDALFQKYLDWLAQDEAGTLSEEEERTNADAQSSPRKVRTSDNDNSSS